ncbi:hypothetical protein [Deinococcus koreensis]|uniref:hypothetical protein n=1 Tax=Deinococcus koreensis TaxID=2054903 RepID=UPI001FAF1D62|nr:hypothetical protein [Deinococcus koreensis]
MPTDQAVYTAISTDHYPWTDIAVDLATRRSQGASCVFDAWQDGRWARFVWARGEVLGGFTWGGQDVSWATTMQALPRAQVSLSTQSPKIAGLVWAARASTPQPLDDVWPGLQRRLEREMFSGVLVSGTGGSYWDSGQVIGGTLPAPGAAATAYAPYAEVSPQALATLWKELVEVVARSVPLETAWWEVSTRLSVTYDCLDPFAREIALRGTALHIDPALEVSEFRPALLAALRASLARLGVRLADLPTAPLRDRPEWAAAGLETL